MDRIFQGPGKSGAFLLKGNANKALRPPRWAAQGRLATFFLHVTRLTGERPLSCRRLSAMKQYVTVGLTVLAGAALIETALIPGLLIGGAAVLAPRYLPNFVRRRKPQVAQVSRKQGTPVRSAARAPAKAANSLLPKFAVGQAIAKTITYRLIVTSLDFTTNYIVIGEFATAAGLSTFNLVAGPLFYFGHEAVWNYLGHPESGVDVPLLAAAEQNAEQMSLAGFTVSRALAKTITFRTIATVMDFTTNYVVVGDVASAVILSATGFVFGPFVYFGHEKAWDYFGDRVFDPPPEMKLLPASV
jgi:uncharacterized membrane protein